MYETVLLRQMCLQWGLKDALLVPPVSYETHKQDSAHTFFHVCRLPIKSVGVTI